MFLLLLPTLLVGCSSSIRPIAKMGEQNKKDYSDYEDLHLEWKNLFSPAKSQYFVYIYSFSCRHCANIKDLVLDAVEDDKDHFYLMAYSEEIPLINNVSETIGKEKIEDIGILGTPTLIEISNHHVAINIAGENLIKDYIELLPHNKCS